MFKVSKNKKINEKLISNIIPFQNDLKFLINSSDNTNQKFSSLKNNINQANSYFNQIKETSFIVSKTITHNYLSTFRYHQFSRKTTPPEIISSARV